MSQAAKCDLFLYVNDSCVACKHKDIKEIQKQLNEDFSNICVYFVDSKLTIHNCEDNTKSIHFASI